MHLTFIGLGSAGDVNPHLGLAVRMQQRGHQVTFATLGYFKGLVEKLGLKYFEILPEEAYHTVSRDPDIWHPKRGFEKFAREILVPAMQPVYECIEQGCANGPTVVVAPSTAYGARIAHDKLRVPLITLNLQPGVFRSEYDTPVMPGVPIYWWTPKFMKRWIFGKMDSFAQGLLGDDINSMRKDLGLESTDKIMEWCHSPFAVVAMFPEWYCEVQPDWPNPTHQTNFPLYDAGAAVDVDDGIKEFLDNDQPFVVFTGGSANRTSEDFFKASIEACQRMGTRGLLLAPHSEPLPATLPKGIHWFGYVPLSLVLPRTAAFVHHGGIGMLSQALKHAVPQLITPRCFDQPDNANRLRRMGVGLEIQPHKYSAARADKYLSHLISSSAVRHRCDHFASKLHNIDGVNETCDLIETLAHSTNGGDS